MRRLPLLLLSLSALACVSRQSQTSKLSEGCLLTSDCVSPLVCVFERCHQPCNDARDCPDDSDCQLSGDPAQLVCTQVQCKAQTPPPTASTAVTRRCPSGQVCNSVDGKCRANCRAKTDCAEGQECLKSQCVWPSTAPSGSFPPIAGETVPDAGCHYTSECPAPLRCAANGNCVAECLSARDCASGLCVDSVCLAMDAGSLADSGVSTLDSGTPTDAGITGLGCQYTSQCDAGAKCTVRGECVPECINARDCALGFTCNTAGACVAMGVMSDGGSTGSFDAGCTYSTQCSTGLRCDRLGNCVVECLTSRDCAAGQECRSNRCVPFIGDGGLADGGLPTGWGESCFVSSNCLGSLVCGATNQCVYECSSSADCRTNAAGQCCQAHKCVNGAFCAVALGDAGVRDAGTVGLDGGACRADFDCNDGDLCNGNETCRAGRCFAGNNPCDDNNPCTIDTCNSTARSCGYASVATDVDQDGHYPVGCGVDGGPSGALNDDCNDNDNTVYGAATELCDWKDNNCNGFIDENRWRERPNARGFIGGSGLYPANGGPPAVARLGDTVVVVAPSHRVNGTHDAYRLAATDFSVLGGPTTLAGPPPTSQWATCAPNVSSRQAVRPMLVSNGTQLAFTGLTSSFATTQAQCCQANEVRTTTANFSTFDGTVSAPNKLIITEPNDVLGGCRELATPVGGSSFIAGVMRPGIAYSPTLQKWIATWWELTTGYVSTGVSTQLMSLRFATIDSQVSASQLVWPGPVNPATTQSGIGQAQLADMAAYVSVGNNTVLFAWVNVGHQPFTTNTSNILVRWVIYDAQLNYRAGPFATLLASSPVNGSPQADPHIDALWFDGTNYQLAASNWPPNEDWLRVLTIGEDGAVQRTRFIAQQAPFTHSLTPTAGYSSGTQLGIIKASLGMAAAVQSDAGMQFVVVPNDNAGEPARVPVFLNQVPGVRTDFAITELTETSFGVVWSDGDLRKTVIECAP